MEYKKFKDIQVGDFLFCANQFGKVIMSQVYKVEHCKKISKIWHHWYGRQQNLKGEESCNDSGGYLRYVATTKAELVTIMYNGIKEYDKQISTFQKCREQLNESRVRLESLTEEEIEKQYND